MTKRTLIACVLAITAVAPAFAQGPYVGVGVTGARHTYESGTQGTVKIIGGYDLTPTWGIEAGYLALPTFKTPHAFSTLASDGTTRVYSAESHGKVMYIAGKATLPISDKFSLVTKLGFAHERARTTFAAPGEVSTRRLLTNDLYAGIGLKYALTEKVGLTLELERLGSNSGPGSGHKPGKVSLNASYSF